MEAIILAGGFGTRLSHVVEDVPKPMAPIGNVPFLKILMDQLIEQGITKIILAVGYKKECISEYFGGTYREIPLIYSVEDTPLYTGGAVKKALTLCAEPYVFVCNGDTYFSVNLKEMQQESPTIAIKELKHFHRYGQVIINKKNQVLDFREKEPCEKGFINGGIYYLPKDCLQSYPACFSLETDFFPSYQKENPIFTYESKGYFIDIGIPEDYYKAQAYFDSCTSVAFFDRDGTININFGYVNEKDSLEFIPETPWYIKGYNEKNIPVIVVTNQAGIAKGYYTQEDMESFHLHMNRKLQENYGAKIDQFYFCPHHPDHTGTCNCRKPQVGLFLQASQDFAIDFENSVMYGDKPADEAAAKALGIPTFYPIKHEKNI